MKQAAMTTLECMQCHRQFQRRTALLTAEKNRGGKKVGWFCSIACSNKYGTRREIPRVGSAYGEGHCLVCGKEFSYLKVAYTGKYCSIQCARMAYRKPESWEDLICQRCGKAFKAKIYHHQKYCSLKCAGLSNQQITCICKLCGESYSVPPHRKTLTHFCSRACLNKWQIIKGRAKSLRNQTRLFSKWWARIRDSILERDHYICQQCGSQKNLSVHHKIQWIVTQDDTPENLITLCQSCHFKTHLPMLQKIRWPSAKQQTIGAF